MEQPTHQPRPVAANRPPQKPKSRYNSRAIAIAVAALALLLLIGIGLYLGMKQNTTNNEENPAVSRAQQDIPGLREAVRKNPDDASARYNLGGAYYATKDYKKAAEEFEQATKKENGNNATYHNSLGNAYRDLEEYDKAAEQYRKAFEIQPTFYNAYSNLAIMQQHSMNDKEAALKTYNTAIEKVEGNNKLGAMRSKAVLLVIMERKDEAKAVYQQILEINPEDPAAQAGLKALG